MSMSTGSDWSYAPPAGGLVNTTAVALVAGVSGVRQYLASLQLTNPHATVATEVVVTDGSGGPVLFRTMAAAVSKDTDPISFECPLVSTRGNGLFVQCVTTGASVYANAQGYSAP